MSDGSSQVTVGIVSDTHGTLDPRIAAAFTRVRHIVHAGDVGGPEVLRALGRIAPVTAVRGNADEGELRRDLPAFATVDVEGVRFAVTHIRERAFGAEDARRIGVDVLVFGHEHVPYAEEHDGLLVLNPGSAYRPRAGSPRSVARVTVREGELLGWEFLALDGETRGEHTASHA